MDKWNPTEQNINASFPYELVDSLVGFLNVDLEMGSLSTEADVVQDNNTEERNDSNIFESVKQEKIINIKEDDTIEEGEKEQNIDSSKDDNDLKIRDLIESNLHQAFDKVFTKSMSNDELLNASEDTSGSRKVFTSEILNNYLNDCSNLDVSYPPALLVASEKFRLFPNLKSQAKDMTELKVNLVTKEYLRSFRDYDFEEIHDKEPNSAEKMESLKLPFALFRDIPCEMVAVDKNIGVKFNFHSSISNRTDEEDLYPKKLEKPIITDDIYEKVMMDNSFRLICPKIVRCGYSEKKKLDHVKCARLMKYHLGMALYFGFRRPLHNAAIENTNLLSSDCAINHLRARLVVSAVITKNEKRPKITRIIVPLVLESLVVDLIKHQIVSVDVIDDEVKTVVKEICDYVVRNEEIPMFGYDPNVKFRNDKRTARSHNESTVVKKYRQIFHMTKKEVKTSKSQCLYSFCDKGCVCEGLNYKFVRDHCGKVECMFECTCPTTKRKRKKNKQTQ